MKYAILLSTITLSGCLATPVAPPQVPKFPPAAPALMEKCPDLQIIPTDKVLLSELTKIITENYTRYHECKVKVDEWIKWYQDQKAAFDGMKK